MPRFNNAPYRRVLLYRASQLSFRMPGDDDGHLDAALARVEQDVDRGLVGYEIGVGDLNRLACADNGEIVEDAGGDAPVAGELSIV